MIRYLNVRVLQWLVVMVQNYITYLFYLINVVIYYSGSVAEWLACWTQAQKGWGSNRSRDAVGSQS